MAPNGRSEAGLRLSVRAADARVELAASAVLRKCIAALGLQEVPLPVPVDVWIERPLGFRFGVVQQGALGEGVLGLARPSEGEALVAEPGDEGRFRFTCAHELGHLVLHARAHDVFRDFEALHGAKAPTVEREADRFASAFLMPVDALPSAFDRVCRERRLAPACYAMLRGDDVLAVWLWRRCFIPALTERFGVSRSAALYRFRELRLPGQRRLLRPSLVPLLAAPDRVLATLDLDAVLVQDGVPTK